MTKKIKCICNICKKIFFRTSFEVKRNKLKKRKIYCSYKCYNVAIKDEYTPYRYFLRAIKKRQKEVKVNLKDLKKIWDKQKGICPLTGKKLSLEHNNKPYQASVDRIDSSKGYIKNNIRYIALIANYCKHCFSDEEVFDFCLSVVTKK